MIRTARRRKSRPGLEPRIPARIPGQASSLEPRIPAGQASNHESGQDLGPQTFGLGPRTFGLGPRTFGLGPRTFGLGPRTFGLGPRTFGLGPCALVVMTSGTLEPASA